MSERIPMMAGNWKMNKTTGETAALAKSVAACPAPGVEVMIAPPFTALAEAAKALSGTNVALGAQNLYPAEKGAYTGEISPGMLLDLGVQYVILGHSERRQIMNESDDFIHDKVEAALSAGLVPVLCVGEVLEDRQAGKTNQVVLGQLAGCLSGLEIDSEAKLVVAYEPVWAIGTGQTATPEQAQDCHLAIRKWLSERYDKGLANSIRILYGGSVVSGNVSELMAQPDIDGALVGGASLSAEAFSGIVGFKQ